LTSIEQKLQTAKQNIEELNNSLDVDSIKNDIENKVKSRDKMEASLSAIDDEIFSLHKLSSLTAEFELNKSTLQAKKEELENLKKKHGDKIKVLLDTQELQDIKLKSALERIQQPLVRDLFSYSV